jgi:chitinase
MMLVLKGKPMGTHTRAACTKRFSLPLAAMLVLFLVLGSTPASLARASGDDGKQKLIGYFIEWGIYGRNYLVKNVVTSGSASKLTHINYAFSNAAPDANGQVNCQLFDEWADYQKPWSAAESVDGQAVTWPNPVLGNFQQLKVLKALYPNLNVLISVGGWTGSRYFSDAALTPQSRAAFVKSCIDLFIKGDLPDPGWGGMGGPGAAAGIFDGIDLDWEWPGSEGNPQNIVRPEDRQNFTALVAEFRAQLDAYGEQTGKHYLLTAFLPAAPAKIDSGFEVDKLFSDFDFATVQGYDLHGSWEPITNHQSNLLTSPEDPANPAFSVNDTIMAYFGRGAPASKLVVGVPFYGRGWTNVAPENKGLYQPAGGAAPGTWEAGVEDYKVLKEKRASGGYAWYWDGKARAAWLFDGTTFWTLDDPKVMKDKAHYVLGLNLAGVMFWELSGDTPDGELVKTLDDALR